MAEKGGSDERIPIISKEDLAQAERLEITDFLKAAGKKLKFIHWNDGLLYKGGNIKLDHFIGEGLPIGEGDINFEKISEYLKKTSFDGLSAMDVTEKDYTNAINMKKGFEYLHRLNK